LTFNQGLDPGSATIGTNYAVLEFHRQGRKLAAESVPVRAIYDPGTLVVSLVFTGKHRFPDGGRLILGAFSNPSGSLLTGNTVFTILPGARGITPYG
jgi:hypothetical protein